MRINILMPDIVRTPAGGHKVVYEYCNRLAADGFDVALYFFPGSIFSKFHLPESIRLKIVKIYGDTINPTWFKLDKRIKKKVVFNAGQMSHADIVMATGVDTALPVSLLPDNYGKKIYFIQDFENWKKQSNDEVYRTYEYGMQNIVISKWLKKIVDEHSNRPCFLIPDGIDTTIFYDKKQNRDRHSIVFHYRSQKHKGCKYAFETIRTLEEKYPDLTVNIISSEKLKFQLHDNWRFFFNVSASKVAEINNRSEVFICSTINEGFGLPGLEAMACGCALASTDYIGVHEYAVDRYNALLSKVKDAQGMADNVIELFENENLKKSIIEEGLKTAEKMSLNNSYNKFKRTVLETSTDANYLN